MATTTPKPAAPNARSGRPPRPAAPSCHRARRAFTLIEVLLALALAVVLLGMLSLGVHLYLRAFEAGRAEVEETQLARTILGWIAADLRAAVPRAKNDAGSGEGFGDSLLDGLSGDASTGSSGDVSSGSSGGSGASSSSGGSSAGSSSPGAGGSGSSSGGSGSGGSSGVSSGDASDTSSGDSGTTFETGSIAGVSGLYGDRYHLQVDCLRAAMIDQGEMLLMPEPSGRTIAAASGVRTVVYYVSDGTMSDPLDAPLDEPPAGLDAELGRAAPRGLVRQEIDRAVASYAQQEGLVDELNRGAEVVAPEVLAIEFAYFDGTDWYEAWDSEALGALPVAVEVAIALRDPKSESAAAPGEATLAATGAVDLLAPTAGVHVYRLLVRIPTAEPTGNAGGSSGEAEDSASGTTEVGL